MFDFTDPNFVGLVITALLTLLVVALAVATYYYSKAKFQVKELTEEALEIIGLDGVFTWQDLFSLAEEVVTGALTNSKFATRDQRFEFALNTFHQLVINLTGKQIDKALLEPLIAGAEVRIARAIEEGEEAFQALLDERAKDAIPAVK